MDNYKILGVKKNASRDEIAKAYKVHYLKYKTLGKKKTKEQEEEFNKIDQAYNELMGYNTYIEDLSAKNDKPVYKFLKIDQDKFETFWMYNKTKFFVALFVIFMVYFYISQMAGRPQYDINMVFSGSFKMIDENGVDMYFDTGVVNLDILQRFKFIKEPIVSYNNQNIYSDNSQVSRNNAAQQKFVVELANGEIDILIMDKSTFLYYASKGFFMDLKNFGKNDIDDSKKVYADFVDNKGNKYNTVYGIDILNTKFIKDNKIATEDGNIIACIVTNSKRKDNAEKILKAIISEAAEPSESEAPEKETQENGTYTTAPSSLPTAS